MKQYHTIHVRFIQLHVELIFMVSVYVFLSLMDLVGFIC